MNPMSSKTVREPHDPILFSLFGGEGIFEDIPNTVEERVSQIHNQENNTIKQVYYVSPPTSC